MKLRSYTPETHPMREMNSKYISLHRSTGRLTISKGLVKAMDIKESSKVSIDQDEETKSWYIRKNPDGFEVKHAAASASLVFNNRGVINDMMVDLGFLDNSVKLKVFEEPVIFEGQKLYAINAKSQLKFITKKDSSELAPKRFGT